MLDGWTSRVDVGRINTVKRLFDPNLVYPSDREGGCYVDLDGVISEVGAGVSDAWRIVVRTAEHGDHYGFMTKVGSFVPEIGMGATIRIYDAGGGWYPDNRITSAWTRKCLKQGCGALLSHKALPFCDEHMKDQKLVQDWEAL